MKHIVANAREKDSNTGAESIEAFARQSSQFEMPRLRKIVISSCRNLVTTFPIFCFELQALLEEINIQQAPSLKHVFGECDHQDHSTHQFQNQNTRPDLNYLKLYALENLVGICPEKNWTKWPSSKRLEVSKCPKSSASWIFVMTSSKVGEVHYPLSNMPKLYELILYIICVDRGFASGGFFGVEPDMKGGSYSESDSKSPMF